MTHDENLAFRNSSVDVIESAFDLLLELDPTLQSEAFRFLMENVIPTLETDGEVDLIIEQILELVLLVNFLDEMKFM
jgi:hypothetical protein